MKFQVVFLLWISLVARAQFPEPATPPNIVIILADDLGYNDVGAYTYGDGTNPAPYDPSSYAPLPGPNQAAGLTPRIDSLATDGLKFTNYYASAAQCSPARAALLTGTYPYRNGIPEVLIPNANDPSRARGLHESERTLPELLKERGYATAAVGKWHLGDTLQFLPTRHGFDSWFGIPYSNDMWPFNTGRGSWPKLYLYENDGTTNYTTASGGQIVGEITTDAEQSYLLEAMTEKALAFIDAEKDRPFFLYFSPHAVHVPCFPHPDFRGDTVSWYYDQVKELDHRVGQIMDRLETHGLTNNTIVIFSSDNGPWLNRNRPSDAEQAVGSAYPLWGRKSTVWEGGPRVPFLVKWPSEIPAGAVRDQIAQHIDLLPTLVKLAGGEVPAESVIDGGDLWPVWKDNGASPSDEFYYFMSTTLYAVRKGDWKYYSTSGSGADAGTLVNLDTDIQEQSDVSGANGAKVSELSGLRTTFWTEINANDRPAGSHSAQGIVVEQLEIDVPEGGSASFRVRLQENPGSAMTVSIARHSGDADLSSAATVVKDGTNWGAWSSLSVQAADDGDTLNGGATFRISASGMPFREVVALEADDDAAPDVEPGLVWPKISYSTLQDANHGLIADGTATLNTIADPVGTTYAWSQVSGDPVVFENAAAKGTGVTFPGAGDYVLRLTTGYTGANALSTDFQVRVDPNGATPPGGSGGATETERVPHALEIPGSGSFGIGFTNYRAIVNWYERYNAANNDTTSDTPNGREVLQHEANSTVPTAAEGAYWVNLAPDSTYTNPAIYQSLGTWNTGDDSSYLVSFDLGDRNNTIFGSLVVQLVVTNAGFSPNDGTSLTTAPGYTVADSTVSYTDASFSGTGNRVLTGLTDTLNATGITDGQEVWIRVTASGSGTQSLIDNLSATSQGSAIINIAPVIDPGTAQSTAYSVNSITLGGSVSDDGVPGNGITTEWKQSAGPGTAVFVSSGSPTSTVSFDYPGDYTLRLIADDGQIKAFRETTGTLDPKTLQEWAVAEEIPSGEQGATDNPDGDSYVNLAEFVYGLNPVVLDDPGAGQIRLENGNLELTVPRDRQPDLRVWMRDTLLGGEPWQEVTGDFSRVSLDPDWGRWSFSLPEPAEGSGFYRLEMVQ